MASNRTMQMAMGKLGKKSSSADAEPDEEGSYGSEGATDEGEGDEEEEPDEAKTAFVDMCKAIKAGRFDEAWDLYQDCKEMG
jgi:hypothetical protein